MVAVAVVPRCVCVCPDDEHANTIVQRTYQKTFSQSVDDTRPPDIHVLGTHIILQYSRCCSMFIQPPPPTNSTTRILIQNTKHFLITIDRNTYNGLATNNKPLPLVSIYSYYNSMLEGTYLLHIEYMHIKGVYGQILKDDRSAA